MFTKAIVAHQLKAGNDRVWYQSTWT